MGRSVFLERLFMGCQIQRALTLKSLQLVDAVLKVMEQIWMFNAGNVNGKGSGIRWMCHKAKSVCKEGLELPNLILGTA